MLCPMGHFMRRRTRRSDQMTTASYEEKKRLLCEKLAQGFPRDKPAVEVVTVPVAAADAEVIRRKPESLRLHAQRQDGVSVLMRPLRNDRVTVLVNEVREVDAFGRPIWPKAGATHEY